MKRINHRRCGFNGVAVALACLVWGCGGSPTQPTHSSAKDDVVAAKDDNANSALLGALQEMQAGKKSGAKVTLAIFGGVELADEKSLNKAVDQASRELSGKRLPRRLRPFVISAANDASLPISLDALSEATGLPVTTLNTSTHVAFVRYLGDPQANHRQIALVLAGALSVLSTGQTVIDLSTRRVLTRAQMTEALADPDVLGRQVLPGAEKSGGTVTFFSRGMAKLALPDLEMGGVPAERARLAYANFQRALRALSELDAADVGDTLLGQSLIACERQATAIEDSCVRIPYP